MAKNPKISVDISAVDQFSGTMARFRQEIAKVNAPLAAMRATMDQRAMSAPFAGIGQGLDTLRARAQNAAGGLSSLAPGMAALTGLGTVAGLARAAVDFGQFGTSLQNTARMAGISARDLYTLQGAARMTGLSADTASGMVTGLNKALHDAQFGRNNVAANYMSALHIPADTMRALPVVANLMRDMAKTDPLAAQRFATIFNIPAEAVPLLLKGGDALAALQAEVARGSRDMEKAVAAANNYTEAQGRLENATIGLRNTLMTTLEPSFTPIVNGFSAWIAKQAETEAGAKSLAGAAEVLAGTALFRMLFGGAATAALLKGAVTGVGGAVTLPLALSGDMGPNSRPTTPEELERVRKGLPMDGSAPLGTGVLNWFKGLFGGGGSAPNGVPATGPTFGSQGDPAGPRGIRNNNPLNLQYVPGQPGLDLQKPSDGRFGRYRNMEDGVAQGLRQLQLYQERDGLKTVGAMIAKWAPPNENDTAGYARQVAKRVGVDPSATVNMRDPEQASRMLAAMARVETGREIDDAVIRRGVARALGLPEPSRPETKPEEPDLTRGGRLPALVQPTGPAASLNSSAGSNTGIGRVAVDLSFANAPDGLRHSAATSGDGVEMGDVRIRRAMPMA